MNKNSPRKGLSSKHAKEEAMQIKNFQKISDSQLEIRTDEGLLIIAAETSRIIRCIYTRRDVPDVYSPIHVHHSSQPEPITVKELDNALSVSTSFLTLWIGKSDCRFVWSRREDGFILLEEGEKELTETTVMKYTTGDEKPIIRRVKTVDGERNFVENLREAEDHKAYHAKLSFQWKRGEQIHGLGQGEEGIYNYRGHTQYLYQHNMRIPVPFLVSDQGYAILADCGSLMTFNDDERGSYLYADTVEQMDYYFIAGNNMDDLIDGFRRLTGRAAMLPKWAFGYVQSREKYSSQEELIQVAERYRELGIGLDCVVQDWKTWPADDWGCKILDKKRYPDIKAATDKLHRLHVHAMVSVWPNMNYGTKDYQEMSDAGFLLNDLATYDAFDEKARELYWKQCDRELFSGGFDAWWCDSTEPFSGPDWNGEYEREPWERFLLVGKEHKKFLGASRANLYAVAHAKGIFENQRKEAPGKRVLNLTRSGYAGSQQYGTVLWSGDVSARWDVLKKQVREALNMAMSGMPYWTFDIGGFFVFHKNWQQRGCECNNDPSMKWFWHGDFEKGLDDPGYRELYVRWFQFGAFLPMFRSHGTDVPREIWNFGKPGEMFYDALANAIRNRYRLIPYIYSMAGQVVQQNSTMVRSLLFDFPDDLRACAIDNAYMFGDSLLVFPVTDPMYYGPNGSIPDRAKTWTVYLPEGCGWYDFYTDVWYEGGQTLQMDVNIDHIPVFVRAGSILPMEAGTTYAEEVPETPFELHLYPSQPQKPVPEGAGAARQKDTQDAASCTANTHRILYYEDEGDGYGYETGLFNQIPVTWNETDQTLKIGASTHRFDSGLAGRNIRLIQAGTKHAEETVCYTGEELTVSTHIS